VYTEVALWHWRVQFLSLFPVFTELADSVDHSPS
jgi:hypothetical protein